MDFLTSRRFLGLIILSLWAASLALPVFTTCPSGYDHVGGWFLLLTGWMGFMVLMPAWLANFFIVAAGAVLFFHRRPPIWLGVLAGAFAATAWWWTVWTDDTGEVPICHYHEGYWIWLAVAAVVTVIPFFIRKVTTPTQS